MCKLRTHCLPISVCSFYSSVWTLALSSAFFSNRGVKPERSRRWKRRQGVKARKGNGFLILYDTFLPFTCNRRGRRSRTELIGVQSVEPHACSWRCVWETQWLKQFVKCSRSLFSGCDSCECVDRVFLDWHRVEGKLVRKEGSRGLGERPKRDEFFEAERVVKLRPVQAETRETRQLWESGWGKLQVSLSGSSYSVSRYADTAFWCWCKISVTAFIKSYSMSE